MQASLFKDVLVPVIGGLGIFMLGLEFTALCSKHTKRPVPITR